MNRFSLTVTPLYKISDNGVPELGGTGTWLKVDTEKFLITAAHVADEGFLWFPKKAGFKRLASPCVATAVSASGSRDHDRVDLAFFHLTEEDAAAKHPLHRYAEIADVDVNLACRQNDTYHFVGFPCAKDVLDHSKCQTNPECAVFTSELVTEKIFEHLGLSIDTHVVVQFPRTKMFKNGRRVTAPKPHGLSGGPVWKVDPTFFKPKLAAIAIECRQDCLVGTRIAAVLEAIRLRLSKLSALIPFSNEVGIIQRVPQGLNAFL